MVLRVSLVVLLAQVATAGPLPFSDTAWRYEGDAARAEVDGRDVVTISSGWAHRPDVKLEDGTIDVDVKLSDRRSFVYVAFRMTGGPEFEELYLRPHKSNLPDAVQYAPVYAGHSAWQLYHGPGAVAAIGFEPGAWTPVRVVVKGRRVALFVGDMSTPALLVPRLGHAPRSGHIALRAFLPPGTPGREPAARFSNVVVRPGFVPPGFDALPFPPVPDEPNAIPSWALSSLLPMPADGEVPALPGAGATWRVVDALPSGLVEMHRHVDAPEGTRQMTAAGRVTVKSATAGPRAFDLGFSDDATLYLNGQPVYHGQAGYSYAGRRDGLIGYDQARVYLPLRAGDNELIVVVRDGFGGMGLMGRFPDRTGLAIEAR